MLSLLQHLSLIWSQQSIRTNFVKIAHFKPINIYDLMETVLYINSSTCCLKPLPTEFLKDLACLSTELLQKVLFPF